MQNATPLPLYSVKFGPAIGEFLGQRIFAWLQLCDGNWYDFSGVAPGPRPGLVNLSIVGEDQIVVTPGLLFSRRTIPTGAQHVAM